MLPLLFLLLLLFLVLFLLLLQWPLFIITAIQRCKSIIILSATEGVASGSKRKRQPHRMQGGVPVEIKERRCAGDAVFSFLLLLFISKRVHRPVKERHLGAIKGPGGLLPIQNVSA